ncbi:MAG: hypothetical protein HQL75_11120 [Magnetococcales bacterium]|nr:hypothetical protein [Magnetococcales bacterium]
MANDDLLKLYGGLVDDFFRGETKASGGLFLESPSAPESSETTDTQRNQRQNTASTVLTELSADRHERAKAELRKVLPVIILPNDRARINAIVSDFKKNLDADQTHDPGSKRSDGTIRHLKHFRDQIAVGQENSLEHNPFHELTRLTFQSTLKGLFSFFAQESRSRLPKLPPPVRYSPTLREIWNRPKEFGGFFANIAATLAKWIILTRPPLAILLFIGSSYTTYRGVNDLLQSPDLGTFIQTTFSGQDGEGRRYLIALFCGIALSSAILDFKTRLFAAIANTGRVFVGIRNAFYHNPRWMILALILTTLSIKTNYDGIVSIFSKREDLAQQTKTIRKGIQEALGNRFFASSVTPDSLFDLKAVLDENIATLIPMLESIPNDEAEGLASSGDARKGPRYWAKHFIIFGGYEPGVSDVNLSHNTPFSQSVDVMLTETPIDFHTSVQQKIRLIGNEYVNQLDKTETAIASRLAILESLTHFSGYTIAEIKRLLAVEHYQINALVTDIIHDLETSKDIYQTVVEDLHAVTKAYLDILLKIDRSGNIQPGDYVITASVNVPRIEAIDKLREGMIPEARHKSFAELRFFLMERYGAAAGGLLLTTILILSISMDLADPILFARSVARHGRRDLESVKVLLDELTLWEKQFTQIGNELLDSPYSRAVLGERSPMTKNEVEMRFHQQVERLNAEVKNPHDRNPIEGLILWFMGMFLLNRPSWTRAFNVRLAALNRLIQPNKNILEQWYSAFFLEPGKTPGNSGPVLTETCIEIRNNAQRTKDQVNRIVKAYSKQLDALSTDDAETTADPKITLSDSRFPLRLGHLPSAILQGIHVVFFKPIQKPPVFFPLSFYHWRKEFVHSLARSSNLKNLIARLQPELQSLLDVTIPSIFENSYYPIVDIKKKYDQHMTDAWKGRFAIFEARLMEFEQSLLESLGMIPALAGTGSQADFLETLNGMESRMNLNTTQILEVLKVIDNNRDRHSDQHVITGLALEEESQHLLEEAHLLIVQVKEAEEQKKRLEEEKRIREMEAMASTMDTRLMELRQIFNDISQTIMRMKMREMSYRKKGFPSQAVMLNHHLNRSILDQAPKEADAIIQVMETILQSEHPYSQRNLDTLEQLKAQAMEIQDRMVAFQDFKGIISSGEGGSGRPPAPPSSIQPVENHTPFAPRDQQGSKPIFIRRPPANKVK